MPIIISGGSGGGLPGVTVSGTAASGKTVVASSSSAAAWAYPPGFEFVYAEVTSSTNITDTSEATATQLIGPLTATFDGGPVLAIFQGMLLTDSNAANDQTELTLFEGSTQIGRLGRTRTLVIANPNLPIVRAELRFTPTAGAHTYKLCGFVGSTTGTPAIIAGSGGTAGDPPAFCRIVKR